MRDFGIGAPAGALPHRLARAVQALGFVLLILPAALAIFPFAASAQERILSYNVLVEIREDGSLDLTERIRVRAEGNQIRRGIYRDFPTRYRDRAGNRVNVGFEVVGVERDRVPEPWFTESVSGGVRVNTGNDDFLPVPAEYEYTLRYRTTHQIGFFESHDELYWNAIGTGWIFPIEEAAIEVRLPLAVPVDSMGAEGYTGPQGAQGTDYLAELSEPGVARYRTTRALAAREGFTIVLTFPKGILPEPTRSEQVARVLGDNRGVLVALTGFVLFLTTILRAWNRVGRDPRKGVVIPQYEPRPDFSPAAARYLTKMAYDMRALSGDVLSLAVAGALDIRSEDRFFGERWILDRRDGPHAPLTPSQDHLLRSLFAGGRDTLALEKVNAKILSEARREHNRVLGEQLHPRYYRRNSVKLVIPFFILAATMVVALLISGGYGVPIIALLGVLMGVLLTIFGRLLMAPTLEGRKALDDIEGLKLYLTVAEKDEFAQLVGPRSSEPRMDAARYEALLPYAVALEVEEAWTKKFTLAVGVAAAAAATSQMSWYHGHRPVTDLSSFGRSIGSGFSSQIASASSPPGSSSGSGGGGSSGGGGGGGGGGGR